MTIATVLTDIMIGTGVIFWGIILAIGFGFLITLIWEMING